jgi:hypothetical protein
MLGKLLRWGCGTIIFVILTALLAILFLLPPYGRPLAWWMPLAFAVSMWLLIVAIRRLYFDPSSRWQSREDFIKELAEKDWLEEINFRAQRAFQVEEFEDEGSHYFIELEDKSVLYLNGQYLYEYEEIDDDPELNQPRRFPCTEFAIRRHKKDGYAIEILCGGSVIEPEITFPPFDAEDYRNNLAPEDGQIIRTRTYEQLKTERLQNARS